MNNLTEFLLAVYVLGLIASSTIRISQMYDNSLYPEMDEVVTSVVLAIIWPIDLLSLLIYKIRK
jgi:hypothetical protein